MVDKKKDTPQKGEFIDLDKSDFKKKTGLTKIFFKYFIIFIVFFSLGFLTYKPLKENFYHKFKGTEIIEQEVVKIDQEKLKNEYLLKLGKIESNFSEKLNFYEERINNLESKNKELSVQLDSVNQSFENFQEFNPNDSHLLDYKKNEIYESLILCKEAGLINKIGISADNVSDVESIVNIFDIDVVGGANIKNMFPDQTLSIFVMPPSIDILKDRLLERGDVSLEEINVRVKKAESELDYASRFDNIIINNDLEESKKIAHTLIKEFIDE